MTEGAFKINYRDVLRAVFFVVVILKVVCLHAMHKIAIVRDVYFSKFGEFDLADGLVAHINLNASARYARIELRYHALRDRVCAFTKLKRILHGDRVAKLKLADERFKTCGLAVSTRKGNAHTVFGLLKLIRLILFAEFLKLSVYDGYGVSLRARVEEAQNRPW